MNPPTIAGTVFRYTNPAAIGPTSLIIRLALSLGADRDYPRVSAMYWATPARGGELVPSENVAWLFTRLSVDRAELAERMSYTRADASEMLAFDIIEK